MHHQPTQPTTLPRFLQPDPAWANDKTRLWAMTATQRIHAMRSGDLSLRLCLHWVSQRPHECPLVNGEWEFIAARTPDIADRDRHQRQRARVADSLLRRPDSDELAHRHRPSR